MRKNDLLEKIIPNPTSMENGKIRRHFFTHTSKVVLLSSILMLGAIITASPGLFSHTIYGQELDADFDGIADIDDFCPDDAQNMCFDSDGDGVADSSSASTQEPDVPEQNFDGGVSVDSNADGVADSSAADTDSDGVADMDDPCPSDAQDLCIDSDGDGITDVDEKKRYCEEQAKITGAIADANCAKQVTVQNSGELGGEVGVEKGGAKGSLSASGGKTITETYDRTKLCALKEKQAYDAEYQECMNAPEGTYTPPDLGDPLPTEEVKEPCPFWGWCVGDFYGDG